MEVIDPAIVHEQEAYLTKCLGTINNEIMPAVRNLIEGETIVSEPFELHALICTVCNPTVDERLRSGDPYRITMIGCNILYEAIVQYCTGYLHTKAAEIKQIQDPYELLKQLTTFTKKLMYRLRKLNNCAEYLNSVLVQKYFASRNLPEVYTATIRVWIDEMFADRSSIAIETIFRLIDQERDRNQTFAACIVPVTQLLRHLNAQCYNNEYRDLFIEKTNDYLARKADEWIACGSFRGYMIWARSVTKQETVRAQNYLSRTNRCMVVTITELCNELLVTKRCGVFYENFLPLLRSRNTSDLRLFYKLIVYEAYDHVSEIALMYKNELQTELQQIESEKAVVQPLHLIEAIGRFVGEHETILLTCFDNSDQLRKVWLESIAKVSERNDFIDLLIQYSHRLLVESGCDEFRDKCELMAAAVKYSIHNEDFVQAYVRSIAKRVFSFEFNFASEKYLIDRLETVLLPAVAYKLTRLVPDLQQSIEWPIDRSNAVFNMHILCDAYWPTVNSSVAQQLPEMFRQTTVAIETAYKTKYPHRKLRWQWDRFEVTIVTKCFGDSYLFESNMIHAAIFLAFNRFDCLTRDQLVEAVGISGHDLEPYLEQLCALQILQKSRASYTINFAYANQQTKQVSLLAMSLPTKSTVKSIDNNDAKLSSARAKYLIQSVAVRLMKSLETCPKNELYAKISDEMKRWGSVSVSEITTQLNGLVNRDYLELADNIYTYVP